MSAKITTTKRNEGPKSGDEVEVLYQRMGDRWFAFSLINDEVFVGSLTDEELEAKPADKKQKLIREAGNS